MKVFIVYASAGAGHQKAAEALYEYLKAARPDLWLKLIDVLDYTRPLIRLLYSQGYIYLISRLPWLWYILFRVSFFFLDNPLYLYFDYINSRAFIELLEQERPEIIVSTHFLTSSIITAFREKKGLNWACRHISVVTDYNLHPLWIGRGVDLYVASCEYVKEELLARGVPAEKVRVYGIPVRHKFYLPADREETARKLSVDPSRFTVLIITGAIGIGPIEQIVRALAGCAQLLVVCGRNQRLYRRILNMNLKAVKPFPLINNVDELMSVSDAVLTKAGGLTITEGLIKRLPLVFFASVPGLESSNARVVNKYGAALKADSVARIKDVVLTLRDQPEIYQKMRKNIDLVRKENALKDISGLFL